MNSMLKIGEKVEVDDSIKSYERFGYLPISGTNLNTANSIGLIITSSTAMQTALPFTENHYYSTYTIRLSFCRTKQDK